MRPAFRFCAQPLAAFVIGLLSVVLSACGGGGGSSSGSALVNAGTTADPNAPSFSFANSCTVDNEKRFARSYLNENYLWYSEIPNINFSAFSNVPDYFYSLLVTTPDANGLPKDQFSFVATLSNADSFASGINIGFGVEWQEDQLGRARVAQVTPGSPAALAGMARGGEFLGVIASNTTGWFPNVAGAFVTFNYRDTPAAPVRSIRLDAAPLVENPVPQFSTLVRPSGRRVGYILFNDHSSTAQDPLIDAITSLRTGGINDLVLDMRYNTGGFLYVALSLASMITGPASEGRVFERLQFNNKRAADSASAVFNFSPRVQFSDSARPAGSPLPQLALPKVYVLTSAFTCSASESVVNGLRGIDVEVVLVGQNTCGKPYGFSRQDNCNLALFPIEFEGFNAKNAGGYTAGFAPTCAAADDFDHALGDIREGQLATALHHIDNGICPPVAMATARGALSVRKQASSGGLSTPAKPVRPGKLLTPRKP